MSEDSPVSLVDHIRRYRDSQGPAVQTDRLTLSYDQLLRLIDDTGRYLSDAGVTAGDRVVIHMPNSAELIVAVLAVVELGAVAVPVDVDAGGGRLADVVRQTSPHFCMATPDQAAVSGLPTVRLRIDPATGIAECVADSAAPGQSPSTALDEEIAFIRFTSGSTGHAKGVVLTQAQQLWTARMLSGFFQLDTAHREFILASMALSGGWQRVAATLYSGGCVIVAQKALSVGDLLDDLVSCRASGFFTPPPLVRMLLASDADRVRTSLRHCRTIEIGSAALAANELQSLVHLVPDTRVYVHYGLTECSRACILDAGSNPQRLATVGQPAPGVDIRIVDEHGNELPAGRSGQILLRGPQLAGGYWQQPELSRQRFNDGWLATGDYGVLDEAGFLTLRGRHDDMINCGGHCYFPGEVEHALGMPVGIEQYLVAGVADPRGVLGDVAWAFVVPVTPDDWTPAEFLALARKRLPAHMVPRQVVVMPALPLTPSGKPDRRETVRIYGPGTQAHAHEQTRNS